MGVFDRQDYNEDHSLKIKIYFLRFSATRCDRVEKVSRLFGEVIRGDILQTTCYETDEKQEMS